MLTISYAITVKDELQEIKTLLVELASRIRSSDEVVILFDSHNGDPEVWEYLTRIDTDVNTVLPNLKVRKAPFQGNFADWKNRLTKLCTGHYIFNIDADEIPDRNLISQLPFILDVNQVDMLRVPRVNTVEGITEGHIEKWGWNMNEKGWINWPDLQMRIYRNTPEIKWKNKVHEVLEGYKTYGMLPVEERFALYHHKAIERQEKQNNYYSNL